MKLFLLLPVLFISLFALNSHAQYDHGNGGDMCELRIKEISTDLQTWLLKGGANSLNLPQGVTLDSYKSAMLSKIQKAKVSCSDEIPKIGKAEKTCVNFVDQDGSARIICNDKRFNETVDTEQYILVHHEFAGLAGFESNSGESSNYYISNQITAYLETQLVKKLAIKPAHEKADAFDPTSCEGEPLTMQNSSHLPNVFAMFQLYVRDRECTDNGCGPWKNAPNHLPPPGTSQVVRPYTPREGEVSITTNHATNQIGIELSSTDRDLEGRGAYIVCNSGANVVCNIISLPSFEKIGQATGVITTHCLRLTFKPNMFPADKAYFENKGDYRYAYRTPWQMPNIAIEQEKVFFSRY